MPLTDSASISRSDSGSTPPNTPRISATAVFDTSRPAGSDGVIDFPFEDENKEGEMGAALKLLSNDRPVLEKAAERTNIVDRKKEKEEVTWWEAVRVVAPLRGKIMIALETHNGVARALCKYKEGRSDREFCEFVNLWLCNKVRRLLVEDGYISEKQKTNIQVTQ